MNTKDQVARAVTSVHAAVFRASRGRVLNRFSGMPVLMLTTTGRKSGQRRTTMLAAPIADEDKVVLVASYGGDDRDPSWFLNLKAHPSVTVTMGGRDRPMTARVASAEEKAELWPQVVRSYKGYAGYQEKTRRQIPLVILEP